jgi:alpha-1,6-mannosyltransferase
MNIVVNPMFVQFLARFCLLLFNFWGWIRLALAVDRRTGALSIPSSSSSRISTGSWLLLITACQFHIPFYASRMLPNTFAFSIVLQSYSCWIDGNIQSAASLLVLATAIFRCDLLLLLGSIGLSWLYLRQLTVPEALKIGIFTGICALLFTVPVDSVLWQRPLWPEGEVFYFNTILGKSKEWGISPWYWYFASALPKAMLLTLLLVPLSIFRFAEILVALEQSFSRKRTSSSSASSLPSLLSLSALVDTTWLRFILPIFGFIGLYSFLGHKEMRFIFPALPMLNLGAAVGVSKLSRLAFPQAVKGNNKDSSLIASFGFGCCLLCMILSLCGSLSFVAVSKLNYPGGNALSELAFHLKNISLDERFDVPFSVHVHIDVASAMSGVSLFGQRAAQASTPNIDWKFSKDGYEEGHSVGNNGYEYFTHLLSENPDVSSSSAFQVIQRIPGKPRFGLRELGIITEDTIFVMERIGWREEVLPSGKR